ncbi:MAG TPA: Uma2 family endonuclease [Fimbriiglobus sp.]|nr:Uma2 family endonuclease [Fimbriiglobus sp.]
MNMKLTMPELPAVALPPQGYCRRLFSKVEYWRMSDLGFFIDQKVELIAGEVIQMAAQGNRHTAGITLVARALDQVFQTGYWVRTQGTLDLTPSSMPDPDIAVVTGDPAHPDPEVPKTALLIVEVSDSTLSDDRNWKASLYAAAGITDYWILNLQDNRLEIRRDPTPDATQAFGHSYSTLTTLVAGDFASPLAAPTARVSVADLLPG